MELDPTRRVQTRKRKPFSDFTNTFDSHSSSSVPFKSNPLPSYPFNNSSTNLNNPSNPSSPPSPILSTPSLKSSSLRGSSDVEASGRISITYTRRRDSNQRKDKGKAVAFSIGSDSNQRKDKGKAVAISISSAPNLKISNSWEKSGRVDGANVPKTKALTVPLRKKHRSVSSEQDVLKDPVLQDFIEKQRAYFKSIDEFKLSEEEVESGDELD